MRRHATNHVFLHTRLCLEFTEQVTEGYQPLEMLGTLTQMLTQTQDTNAPFELPISVDLNVVRLFKTVSWLHSSNTDIRSRRHYASRK